MIKQYVQLFFLSLSVITCQAMQEAAKALTLGQIYDQMFAAIEDDNLQNLKDLLGKHNINPCDVRGLMNNTLLHDAAYKGRENIVIFLLEQGLSPIAQNKKYNTPVSYTAQTENTKIMELLLAKDASFVSTTGWKNTQPLHWAAKQGCYRMVHYLLDRGANVNARTTDGDTPLTDAILGGHISCVVLLLERGAQTCIQNYQWKGSMNLALYLDPEGERRINWPLVEYIKQHLQSNKELQAKLQDNCAICLDSLSDKLEANKLENLHELTCCKKIIHQKCLEEAHKRKKLCPLCRKNPEALLEDTTAPHPVPYLQY